MTRNVLFKFTLNRGPQTIETLSLPQPAPVEDNTDASATISATDGTKMPSILEAGSQFEVHNIKTIKELNAALTTLKIKNIAEWVVKAGAQASTLRRDVISKKLPRDVFHKYSTALRWYAIVKRWSESPYVIGDWLLSRSSIEVTPLERILSHVPVKQPQTTDNKLGVDGSVPSRPDNFYLDLLERESAVSAFQSALANVRSRIHYKLMVAKPAPKHPNLWVRIFGAEKPSTSPLSPTLIPLESLSEELKTFGYKNLDRPNTATEAILANIIKEAPQSLDADNASILQRKLFERLEREDTIAAYSNYPKMKGKKLPPDGLGVPVEAQSMAEVVSYVTPTVKILGFQDLMTVESQLSRYEVGEIAHIENILKGEYRSRRHELHEETEVVQEGEETVETESKSDLETNERFQLQSEVNRSLQEQIQASGSITATYLGTVSVTANVSGSYQRNRTEAERTASELSRSVTERASERLLQRRRTLDRRRSLRVVTEENIHRLEGLNASYSGVYSWVDKIEKVELRHYGTRLLLEFTIPEPSAEIFIRRMLMQQMVKVYDPGSPPNPNSITPNNYRDLAFKYHATDLKPPPPQYKTVEYAWKATPPTGGVSSIEAKTDVKIPNGYRPYNASAIAVAYADWIANVSCFVSVAGTVIRGGGEVARADELHEPQGKDLEFPKETDSGVSILIRMYSYNYSQGAELGGVLVQIRCQRTIQMLQQWQIETYQSLVNAYSLLLSELSEKSKDSTQGFKPTGQNPLENQAIELTELKRAAITIMRGGATFPEPESPLRQELISFFEQCFEWNQSSHILHPYYWAAPERWEILLQTEDADPQHQEFLRAGAATLIVPIAADREEKVLHYLTSSDLESDRLRWELPQETIDAMTSDDATITSFVNDCEAAQPIWMEVLLSRKGNLIRGAGTLSVKHDSDNVTINGAWTLTPGFDEDRELFIEGVRYTIASIDSGGKNFKLDRPYIRADNNAARYLVGSVLLGKPWEVRVPTSLIVLGTDPDRGITRLNTDPDISAHLAKDG